MSVLIIVNVFFVWNHPNPSPGQLMCVHFCVLIPAFKMSKTLGFAMLQMIDIENHLRKTRLKLRGFNTPLRYIYRISPHILLVTPWKQRSDIRATEWTMLFDFVLRVTKSSPGSSNHVFSSMGLMGNASNSSSVRLSRKDNTKRQIFSSPWQARK